MQYFKELNNIFKFSNILKNSILLGFLAFIIDYLNVPTLFITKDFNLSISVMGFIILLIILDLLIAKKYKLINTKNINILDKNFLIFLFTILFYSTYLIVDFKMYKIIGTATLLLLILVLVAWRILHITYLLKKKKCLESNTYDLQEFLQEEFITKNQKELILFNETDVKYDLLNRDIFIDYIASSVNSCNPKNSFVFGLNGQWGSGKTTILNLVKDKIRSEDLIIIDDFNPWAYNDNITLFRGFYDSITKNEDIKFDYSLYKKFYSIYKVLILGNENIFNKINFDAHFMDNTYSLDEIKKTISAYLKLNNKKVVYIIDNIDRLDKEQLLIIFKTIATLFDFDNFVYILSFDKERVSNIFEKELKVDPNYLNKIINTSINLPKVNPHKISTIACKTILKLFDYYELEISSSERKHFLNLFSGLSKELTDMRELKRFLNYISGYINLKDIHEQVNIVDFVVIQLIKYLNIELYDKIYNNPIFFISEDRGLQTGYEDGYFFADKFNAEAKKFYDNLFESDKNRRYKDILGELFPYVKSYLNDYEIRTSMPFDHDQSIYNESVVSKKIFNGRYFEHYFELTSNEYAFLLKDVNKFIENINNTTMIEQIGLYYRLFLVSDGNNQRHALEILGKSLDKVNNNILIYLGEAIYNNINKINIDSNGATALGTRERCMLILSDIFNLVEESIAKESLTQFIKEKNNLRDIDNLIYWLNPEKQYQRSLNTKLYDFAKAKFIEKLNDVVDNNIDIISNVEYGKFSIRVLEKYSIEIDKIKILISKILNKDNIFKFLRNYIAEWVGAEYSYEFNHTLLNELISEEDIRKILETIDYSLTQDQQLILDIYNKTVDIEEHFATPIMDENI